MLFSKPSCCGITPFSRAPRGGRRRAKVTLLFCVRKFRARPTAQHSVLLLMLVLLLLFALLLLFVTATTTFLSLLCILFICQSLCLPIHVSIYISIYPSINRAATPHNNTVLKLGVHALYLSISLFTSSCIYLHLYLFIYQSSSNTTQQPCSLL